MHWNKVKDYLVKTWYFQEEQNDNLLTRSFYIPCGSKGMEYRYSSSNAYDQQTALCRVTVTPATVSMELFDRPFVLTYDGYGKTYLSWGKENEEWNILMQEYKKEYNKIYPLSFHNVETVLTAVNKLQDEMPHCLEDVEIG